MPNNPYIPLVEEHDKIFTNLDEIYSHKWKWDNYFDNNKKIRLEIWTWLWNFFSTESAKLKEKYNFIWMEIKYKRLFKTAEKTLKNNNNDFILLKDFGQNIDKIFNKNEIETTYIFFPEPWPKDRHAKHRIMQSEFLEKLHNITQEWWKLIFKTDHRKYFDDALELIKKQDIWQDEIISYDYENEISEKYDKSNLTEFEVLFRNKDIKINYAEFIKK